MNQATYNVSWLRVGRMNTAAKLSAYGLSLAVVFTGMWAVGNAVGPFDAKTPASGEGHHSAQPGNRGDAPPTTTVAPPRSTDSAPQQVQPPTTTRPEVSGVSSAPVVATSSAPARSQLDVQPELVAVREPVRGRSEPHSRHGELGGHGAGLGEGVDRSRRHHQQQQSKGEGHR